MRGENFLLNWGMRKRKKTLLNWGRERTCLIEGKK